MSEPADTRLDGLRRDGGCFFVDTVARFAITGADRLRYLNGQISNDLRKLVPGIAMRACVLSARGKLDAVVWIWSENECFVIECEGAVAEMLAVRLERYVVADDVQIAPLEVPGFFHVFGPASANQQGLKVERLGVPGVDVAASPEVWRATPEEVDYLRIERALPKWGAELGPDTLPAEAGLEAAAVDFHKGCYIGQEVVSRIRSVGHANRALRVFDVIEGAPPAVGAEFFIAGEPARPAAAVTSVHFGLSSPVGLCYIKRGTPEGAVLQSPSCQIQLRLPACALSS